MMFLRLLCCLAAVGCLLPSILHAQITNTTPTVHDQLQNLVYQVQAKAHAGLTTEADLTPEIAQLDALIATQKGTNDFEAAQISYMKAVLYLEVMRDLTRGAALMHQIATNYPNTNIGKNAADIAVQADAQAARMEANKKIAGNLTAEMPFPDFAVTNLAGAPLSVGGLKSKVVLVDFWATWCVPCRMELPDVIALYGKYHSQGFEIVGVSLDTDRSQLEAFLKQQNGMTWPQYFDGQRFEGPLALKYGLEFIPDNILVGPDGKIIGRSLHGMELEAAVAKALPVK